MKQSDGGNQGSFSKIIIYTLSVLTGVCALFYVISYARSPRVYQPVQFNHQVHVKKNELACTTCHMTVEEEMHAGKPQTETCGMCHAESVSKSPEEKKVVQYVQKNEPIPWERIYKFKLNIFFSHRKHVTDGKINCVECHGNMPDRTTPPTKPLVKITMNKCLNCHVQKKVTTDCNACHR